MQQDSTHKRTEIGGYFTLEVSARTGYHTDAIALNTATQAFAYVLRARKYRKIWIPYYICDHVMLPIRQLGLQYEMYHIDQTFNPCLDFPKSADEVVLCVNYFGLNEANISSVAQQCNVIVDNCQAFYCKPVKGDGRWNCDTIYSCRKFFGVPDGAYLYADCFLSDDLPLDVSYGRMTHLLKRIDATAQEAYADFARVEDELQDVAMCRMSALTDVLMRGVDYETVAQRRRQNFVCLDRELRGLNLMKWHLTNEVVPMVYPLLVDDGAALREHLIGQQIFCARYWPNVAQWCDAADWEFRLMQHLVCLPIDQRYDEEDMQRILHQIKIFLA